MDDDAGMAIADVERRLRRASTGPMRRAPRPPLDCGYDMVGLCVCDSCVERVEEKPSVWKKKKKKKKKNFFFFFFDTAERKQGGAFKEKPENG